MADIIAAGGILCITKMMHRQFLVDYPEAHDILNRDYAPRSSVELLDLVQNGTCDAVVMTDTDFEAAIRRNENYCSQMVMLRDAALLEIDVIYPHGSYQSHGNRYKHSLDFRGYLQIRNSFDRMIGSDCKLHAHLLQTQAILIPLLVNIGLTHTVLVVFFPRERVS